MSDCKYNIEETKRRIEQLKQKKDRAGQEVCRIYDLLINVEYEEKKLVLELVKHEQHLRDLLKK